MSFPSLTEYCKPAVRIRALRSDLQKFYMVPDSLFDELPSTSERDGGGAGEINGTDEFEYLRLGAMELGGLRRCCLFIW